MAVFTNIQGTYSPGYAPEIAKYFDRNLLRETEPNLVYHRDMQKRSLPLNNGRDVQFRKFNPLPVSTTPIKEGVTPDGRTASVTEKHVTIKEYGDYISFTNRMNLTTIDNITQEYSHMLNRQARESLDAIDADAANSGLNVIYADANGGVNTARSDIVAGTDILTSAHIKRAVRALEKVNAERFPDGYYHCVVGPETKFDLTADSMWVDVAKYQNSEKWEQYELGKMLGVKFFLTNNPKIFKSTEVLYTDNGTGVTNLAINDGTWSVTGQTGYVTVAKTTAYASGTDADYDYWCVRMAGKFLRIYDASATAYMDAVVDRAFVDGTNLKLTLRYVDTASNFAYAAGDKIYALGAGASSADVYSTIVYGQNALGCVELGGDGGNIEAILKAPGSSGAEDPLNQRGTVAWHVNGYAASVLQDAYIVRIEHSVSA